MRKLRVFPLHRQAQVGYFARRMIRIAIQKTAKTIKMPCKGALEEFART